MSSNNGRFPAPVAVRLFLFLMMLAPPALFANPFLSAGDGKDVAPAAVSGQGDARLVRAQVSLRERIAEALSALKDGPEPAAYGVLVGGAFLYGLFHAAGPGHRKTAVFSLFMGRNSAAWEPAAAGLLAAGIHAGTSVGLILLLQRVGEAIASLTRLNTATLYMEGITFSLLALAAAGLILFKAVALIGRSTRRSGKSREANGIDTAGELTAGPAGAPSPRKGVYPFIVLASLVPCPGATMILLLSLHLGVYSMGVLAVCAMSLGMALVISAAAYLAHFGRKTLFLRFKLNAGRIGAISDSLEMGSYALMGSFALYAAWPFLNSLLA